MKGIQEFRFTELHRAAYQGKRSKVKSIIEKKIRQKKKYTIDVRRITGETPLLYVFRPYYNEYITQYDQQYIHNISLKVIELLLLEQADVNASNNQGFTPIICAARSGDIQLVKLLLDAGADKTMKTRNGKTAYDYAKESGFEKICDLLQGLSATQDRKPEELMAQEVDDIIAKYRSIGGNLLDLFRKYYESGSSNNKLKNYQEAIKSFTVAITAFNEAVKSQDFEPENDKDAMILYNALYNAYIQRGIAKYERKEYQSSIEDCSDAIKLNINCFLVLPGRAKFELALQQSQQSPKNYDAAIMLNPKVDLVFNYRGILHEKLYQYQEAASDFNQAILLNSKIGNYYFNRGQINFKLERYQEALHDYRQAIKLDSSYAKNPTMKIHMTIIQNFSEHITKQEKREKLEQQKEELQGCEQREREQTQRFSNFTTSSNFYHKNKEELTVSPKRVDDDPEIRFEV